MKQCKQCNTQVPDAYKLCPHCGTQTLVSLSSQPTQQAKLPLKQPISQHKKSKHNNGNTALNAQPPLTQKQSQFKAGNTVKTKRIKPIPMLKPWAIAIVMLFFLSSVLLLFKTGDGIANWMVAHTSVAEEEAIAQQSIAKTAVMDYVYDESDADAQLLDQVGQQLVSHIVPKTKYNYHFYLVNSNDINAFALPAGSIFMFDGLYQRLTEKEIATVLAHEIIHVEHQHGLKGIYKNISMAAVLMWVLGANDDTGTRFLHYLSSVKYGRALETEADVEGAKLMAQAGYDPQAAVNMLNKLDAMDGEGLEDKVPEWLLDHPHGKNRAEKVQAVIENMGE